MARQRCPPTEYVQTLSPRGRVGCIVPSGIATDNTTKDFFAAVISGAAQALGHPFIRRFMVVFGLLSAAFDFLTFGVLLYWVRATPEDFRAAWFVESLLTDLAVALVVRTVRPSLRNRQGTALLLSTIGVDTGDDDSLLTCPAGRCSSSCRCRCRDRWSPCWWG